MELISIISVVVVLVVFVLILKLFNSIVKAALSAVVLVLIIGVVVGVVVVNDVNSFQKEFRSNTSTYVLHNDGELIAGFDAEGLDFSTFQPRSIDELPSHPQNLSEDDMYLFINRSVIMNVSNTTAPGMDVSIATLLDSDDEMIRSRGFMLSMFTLLVNDSPLVLFEHMKTEEVEIYPDRTSFSFLKFTPGSLFDMAKDQINVTKNDVVNSFSSDDENNTAQQEE